MDILGGTMEESSVEELTRLLVMAVVEEDQDLLADMIDVSENIALSLTEQEVDTAKANAQKFLADIHHKPTIH
jgi:hypothetical protein